MKQLLACLSLLATLVLGATAATAAPVGTPAWSVRPLTLFEGPGKNYDVTGEIDAAVRIYVDRCSKQWCRVHAGREAGWTKLYDIAFGKVLRHPWQLAPIPYNWGGPGMVCLYEGHNFTGASFCAKAGTRVRDFLLLDADNRYSSVRIEGNVSVDLCRDRDFHSYCERVNESQTSLHGFLDNNVSAMQVY
ncbi:MAG TPA: peptidase inhibitor family I36 protein [Devosia sp.]|jgi:hypothetical protein|uniref:peptidase inhibitor family I36 protein n=1 Tax=Devosia sp. TaxID=1871048 RepID=UPI002DDD208C|nr:peptidase inhibitor family I36 protein [Devosia sp.]HEV2514599.1 peptidase inhibitor family I36 protein [Devosia sp.]